jgi:hypothetical protein
VGAGWWFGEFQERETCPTSSLQLPLEILCFFFNVYLLTCLSDPKGLSFSLFLSFFLYFICLHLFIFSLYLSLLLSLSLSLDVFFFLFLLVLGLMACIKFMGVESRWVCFICCFMCACGVWDHDDGKMVLYPFAMLSSWVSLLFLAFFFLSWFLGFFFLSYPLDFWNFFSAFFVYFTLWFSKG